MIRGRISSNMFPIVALLGLVVSSPGQSQEETVFRSDLEYGSPIDWSRSTGDLVILLPSGGNLELRQGSFVSGALINITPVAMPELPETIEPYGQAYVIDVDPPLLLPVTLRLPIPAGRAPISDWFQMEHDSVEDALRAFDEAEEKEDLLATASKILNGDTIQLVGAASDNYHATVTIGPVQRFYIGDEVTIRLDWDFPAHQITMSYGDGVGAGLDIPSNRRYQTFTHRYQRGGPFVLSWELHPVEQDSPIRAGTSTVLVQPSPVGHWNSTGFGSLYFTWVSNELRGDYSPGQATKIEGELSGTRFEGFWIESISSKPCDSLRIDGNGDPSPYWGTVEIDFSDDFSTLCGTWSYCENESQAWKGWRDGGTAPDC